MSLEPISPAPKLDRSPMFVRQGFPKLTRAWEATAIARCLVLVAIGATTMCLRANLWLKVVGLGIAGLGGAPLYPRTMDAFYRRTSDRLDSVTLGAYARSLLVLQSLSGR